MVAVLALYQTGNLALAQRLGALVELVYHLAVSEGIAVRAARHARILVVLGHQGVEVLTVVDAVEDGLCQRLCLLVRAGFAGFGVRGGDEDVLCGDVVVLKILLELFLARHVHAVLAVVVVLERLIAQAEVHEVGVRRVAEAELCDLVQVAVIAGVVDGLLAGICQLLFLRVRQAQTQLLHLLHDNAGVHGLLLGGIRHGRAECGSSLGVVPQIRNAHLRVHTCVIRHVVLHVAGVLVRVDLIAVDGHNDRCITGQLLIMDREAGSAVNRCAHYDSQHNDQRDHALN